MQRCPWWDICLDILPETSYADLDTAVALGWEKCDADFEKGTIDEEGEECWKCAEGRNSLEWRRLTTGPTIVELDDDYAESDDQ